MSLSRLLLPFISFLYFFGLSTASVPVSGNSMLPTIHDQEKVSLYSFNPLTKFLKTPQKGDIVTFSSDQTVDENGSIQSYIKRVVATENDQVEIRDGYLYVNNQIINEPYTLKSRSTFGGTFLNDCKKITIPKGSVFVMGDNRKRSKDSREIGLISLNDVDNVLPQSRQIIFKDRLRDTTHDQDNHGKSSINLDDYYTKINQIRKDNNLEILNRNSKLEQAALARAKSIIANNEVNLKSESQRSKYPYNKAIKDAGYNNITIGEIRTTGYYNAQELADYWLEYETKENLLNQDFQDTGIAVLVGQIDGCEIQIIVQEFGGYVPPNYEQSDIDGWQEILDQLLKIQPSWQKSSDLGDFYIQNKTDLDRINQIIDTRISRLQQIIKKMKSNQWLSQEEINYTYQDQSLAKEQQSLSDKVNNFKP